MRVELRDRLAGTVVDKFVTHLLHTPELHVAPKLGVSLVFPVHAPPALQPNGERTLPDSDTLAAMAQGVDAVRTTPFTLAPTPETVAAVAASTDPKAKALLASLRTAAAERPMLSASYVPTNLAALTAAGLDGEVASQLGRGAATLVDILGARLDSHTWLATEALDPRVVDALAGRGFDRMLMAEPLLTAVPDQKLTLTRPFVLAGRQTRVQAAAVDDGLAAHFDSAVSQPLAAYHLLADLAVIYLDRPGDSERRGVAAVAPAGWRPTRAVPRRGHRRPGPSPDRRGHLPRHALRRRAHRPRRRPAATWSAAPPPSPPAAWPRWPPTWPTPAGTSTRSVRCWAPATPRPR